MRRSTRSSGSAARPLPQVNTTDAKARHESVKKAPLVGAKATLAKDISTSRHEEDIGHASRPVGSDCATGGGATSAESDDDVPLDVAVRNKSKQPSGKNSTTPPPPTTAGAGARRVKHFPPSALRASARHSTGKARARSPVRAAAPTATGEATDPTVQGGDAHGVDPIDPGRVASAVDRDGGRPETTKTASKAANTRDSPRASPKRSTPTSPPEVVPPKTTSLKRKASRSIVHNASAAKKEKTEHDAVVKKEFKSDPYETLASGKVRPKHEYVSVLSAVVTHLDDAFNAEVLTKCTGIAVFKHAKNMVNGGTVTPVDMYRIMRDFIFTKRRDESKAVWSTPDGKEASLLKRRIMLCCLSMTRRNLFNQFVMKEAPDQVPDADKPFMPTWLTAVVKDKPYIQMCHIHHAVTHNEGKTNSKAQFARREKIAKNGAPSRSDIGFFAMDILYHRLVHLFTSARKSLRNVFFNMVGYLFVDWSKFTKCPVHDTEVRVKWAAPLGEPFVTSLSDERGPSVLPYSKHDPDRTSKNTAMFLEFARERDDVVLLVEHDVIVRMTLQVNSKRRRRGNERVPWRRAVNLMEVLLAVLQAGSGMGRHDDAYELLSARSDAVHLLYMLARSLRVLLSNSEAREVEETTQDELDMDEEMTQAETAFDGANESGDMSTPPSKDGAYQFKAAAPGQGAPELTSEPGADMDDDGAPAVPDVDLVRVSRKFLGLFIPQDGSLEHKLTQVTCCVEEGTYRAEHIGLSDIDVENGDGDHDKSTGNIGGVGGVTDGTAVIAEEEFDSE